MDEWALALALDIVSGGCVECLGRSGVREPRHCDLATERLRAVHQEPVAEAQVSNAALRLLGVRQPTPWRRASN